jgi:hypothetical protein
MRGEELRSVVRAVLAPRWARILLAASFVVAFAVYLLMLPATFTGGRPGLAALAYLTPGLVFWALVLAALLALLVTATVYLLTRGYGARRTAGAASGGVLGLFLSLVTPLLCCTPILPVAIGALAGWLPFLAGGAGGAFQGFLATHESLFFAVSSLLLLGALVWDVREVAKDACCEI